METNPIIQLRENHGLTRRELSLCTGIAYGSLSAAEQGLSVKLGANIANAVGKALGVNPEKLSAFYSKWRESRILQ